HGGIAFLIIYMNNNYFLFKGEDLLEFLNSATRKSIPYNIILSKGYPLNYNYNIGLDYLTGINIAYKELVINEN
ncbi:MAG: Holliday junction resolvase RecU, partial [Bacilli bacterium]|nr:Holliday junction resolvase RecU [Bacilli bacterium]